MRDDEFRLFLRPPGIEAESEEVFKMKGSGVICCASGIILGGNRRTKFFQQMPEKRDELKEKISRATGVSDLDFFEVEDDGENFRVTLRAEIELQKFSDDAFVDAMNRLNESGGAIEDIWEEYFVELMKS
ncbi:hypothetical protein BG20_I0821 [Candidatus Nitrosarchaeum limnium BG20]|uniref:Uncharacterized protein n=2 Tax=Nitrosarchaeum TaxID=1007082 RepID=S2E4P1_9ARCH|nr:hypothetical protein BG20_I0821 [Candidatus Nitrosarchaeum limnium BG20]